MHRYDQHVFDVNIWGILPAKVVEADSVFDTFERGIDKILENLDIKFDFEDADMALVGMADCWCSLVQFVTGL